MNIVIPMAGNGSRFRQAGYQDPKPMIPVLGQPMIELVVQNLDLDGQYTFLVQSAHYREYDLGTKLRHIAPGCNIVCVDAVTQGAACTTLLASQYIDNDQPLVIANSDQFVEWDSSACLAKFGKHHAGIVTFQSTESKWSYASLDALGYVNQVAEKQVISEHATVGIYYWHQGQDYVKYAQQMIDRNIRVNNEFYVAPVFNEAIQDGRKIITADVDRMWGLGTPEDLEYFLNNYHDATKTYSTSRLVSGA